MQLNPLMTLHAELKKPIDFGSISTGNRFFYAVKDGYFEGEKLKGKILDHGGDWLLIDKNFIGHVDVRATLQTEDKAHIYIHYTGQLHYTRKVQSLLAKGQMTAFGSTYFMVHMRFETGSKDYYWLNNLLAIGEGRVGPNKIEYKVMELQH